jgi:hypothetical protein
MKSKGRRYEREIIAILRERGLTVLDVAANCGVYSEHECDLLIDVEGDLARGEVKFRHGGEGFKSVYKWLDAVEGRCSVMWSDGYCTGTLDEYLALHDGIFDPYEIDRPMTGIVREWMKGRDVLFCRMARRPWLVIWRCE